MRLLFLLIPTVFSKCCDLSGEWRNTKGSVLELEQHKTHLLGRFETAVEIREGSAGNGSTHIRGYSHDDMISFSVKYYSSMVAFTGQCYEGTKDTIHVTWILHSKQGNLDDHWLSTRIGQDKFIRRTTNSILNDI